MRIPALSFLASAVLTSSALAQSADSAKRESTPIIQDNSFLVEEAYNQDAGVVQHISTYQIERGVPGFVASFTQEWPVGSITHQLSYSIPISRADASTGVGDVLINYRYQLLGNGDARLAIAPRLSLSLPTGDWKKSRGAGAVGVNGAVPFSYVVSPQLVTHFDLGGSFTPSARDALGDKAGIFGWTTAASAIITSSNRIQPMLEAVYANNQVVTGRDRTAQSESLLISPGIRAAFNFKSGLQIVPGIAAPLGVGPSSGERYLFFYLSFEHPFNRAGRER